VSIVKALGVKVGVKALGRLLSEVLGGSWRFLEVLGVGPS